MVPIRLGDLDDATAYVAQTLQKCLPQLDREEREDYIMDGLAIAWEVALKVPNGESVRAAVGRVLGSRLVNVWRERHPEFRRNTRAGTTTMLAATGLSPEYEAAAEYGTVLETEVAVEQRLALEESVTALSVFRNEVDLTNPRLMGRVLNGTPSHAPLPPGRAAKLWPEMEDERTAFQFDNSPP